MPGSEAGKGPNAHVLAIEHVREMDAGLDKIQRNLLARLQALLASLSPEDPMHERLREVLEALEESLGTRIPLAGSTPSDGSVAGPSEPGWAPPLGRSPLEKRERSR
jgi:hypothetical protein